MCVLVIHFITTTYYGCCSVFVGAIITPSVYTFLILFHQHHRRQTHYIHSSSIRNLLPQLSNMVKKYY